MARAIQGTATNDESPQTDKQRDAFAGSGNLGASKTDMSELFDIDSRGSGRDIDKFAKNRFTATSAANIPEGENPDFNGGVTSLQLLKFSKGQNKFNNIEQADMPSVFGPNLSVPDIDNLPDDNSDRTNNIVYSPTAIQENVPQASNDYSTKGYGVEINQNDPRTAVRSTTFLARRDSDITKLGEWYDTSKYEYEEVGIDE